MLQNLLAINDIDVFMDLKRFIEPVIATVSIRPFIEALNGFDTNQINNDRSIPKFLFRLVNCNRQKSTHDIK